jgi:hypothetical protein
MSESTGITGFIEIFEGRLQKMKLHLKEMRNASAKKCPHCGEKL